MRINGSLIFDQQDGSVSFSSQENGQSSQGAFVKGQGLVVERDVSVGFVMAGLKNLLDKNDDQI